MATLDNYIDRHISDKLIAQNKAERESHKSSGKLSASMLGWPLQWQVLKSLGVPQDEPDAYTLRKFLRGKQIEDWLISQIPTKETQKFVEYKDTIGYADIIVDTADWDFNKGIIPLEVKSVANAKYKRILRAKSADRGHKLQAGLYALSEKTDHYGVIYIASDDLRTNCWIYETAEIKDEIDKIIDRYNKAMNSGTIPVFEPVEDWQANPKYNNYPKYSAMTEEQLSEEFKRLVNL